MSKPHVFVCRGFIQNKLDGFNLFIASIAFGSSPAGIAYERSILSRLKSRIF